MCAKIVITGIWTISKRCRRLCGTN